MKMKISKLDDRKWFYLLLSFAAPCLSMLLLMLVAQYTPFGDRSMLYSDMWHQYYPFFCSFREALRSGESLLYNWQIGMGVDYLGLIAYYLASPLNLLSVLILAVVLCGVAAVCFLTDPVTPADTGELERRIGEYLDEFELHGTDRIEVVP